MSEFGKHPHVPEPIEVPSFPSFEYDDINKADQIGAGGEANVYQATVVEDRKKYDLAVKEPRFDGTVQTEVFERFQAEAETWDNLDHHQNIVSVHGYGTESIPWIGLEYMDGGTLGNHVESVDIAEALWLAGRIAEGIRYGHRHGVAHLDLKPNNILLRETADGLWPYPKVSDWGLAKLLLEHSKSIEGLSPTYAAPEQFNAEEYGKTDDITDIYQFGAIVYELLTGKPPYTGSATEVMQSVLYDEPQPPSERNPDLPQTIDQIVLKALSKEKTERYDSILLFQRQLDNLFIEQTNIDESELEKRDGEHIASASSATETSVEPAESAASTRAENGSVRQSSDGSDTESGSSLVSSRRSLVAAIGVGAAGLGGFWLTQSSANQQSKNSNSGSISASEALTEIWSGANGFRIFAGDEAFYTQVSGSADIINGWALGGYNYQTGEEDFLSDAFGEESYAAVYGPSSYDQDNQLLYVGGSWDIRTQGTADPNNAKLYGVSQNDGSLQYAFETPSGTGNNEIRHVLSDSDDTVVFSVGASEAGPNGGPNSDVDTDPLVFAVDRETGSELWRSTHSDNDRVHFGGLEIYNDQVIATMDKIDVYDSSDGSLLNSINYSSEFGVSVSDDTLFTTGSPVRAYDLIDESVTWEVTPPGGGDVHAFEILDERVYAATESVLFAINRSSGEQIWSQPIEGSIHRYRNPIDTVGKWVWASTESGDIYAVNNESGTVSFTLSDDQTNFRAISSIGDILYVGGESPRAYQVTTE